MIADVGSEAGHNAIILAVGGREEAERTVSLRRLGSQAQEALGLDAAVAMIRDEALAPDMR